MAATNPAKFCGVVKMRLTSKSQGIFLEAGDGYMGKTGQASLLVKLALHGIPQKHGSRRRRRYWISGLRWRL